MEPPSETAALRDLAPLRNISSLRGNHGALKDLTRALNTLEALNNHHPHSQETLELVLFPLVKKWAKADSIISRTLVTKVFPNCYKRSTNARVKAELRHLFSSLCSDRASVVRKAAATIFPIFAESVELRHLSISFVPTLRFLASDPADVVREKSVLCCLTLGRILKDVVHPGSSGEEENSGEESTLTERRPPPRRVKVVITPDTIESCEDTSSTTDSTDGTVSDSTEASHRSSTATSGTSKSTSTDSSIASNGSLVPIYQKLLSDSSASVRHAAVSNLEEFCQNLSPDVQEVMITQRILPFLNRVVKDTNFYVRLAAASALAGLAPIVGKRNSIEHLLPLVAIQLKDSSPEIRLSVVSNVERLKSVIGKREMSKCLLPPIGELAEDSKWRVRMAVVQQLPVIAIRRVVIRFATYLYRYGCRFWVVQLWKFLKWVKKRVGRGVIIFSLPSLMYKKRGTKRKSLREPAELRTTTAF